MEQAPWLAFWPGIFLTVLVYSLNMFGDAVRDPPRPAPAGRRRPPRPRAGEGASLVQGGHHPLRSAAMESIQRVARPAADGRRGLQRRDGSRRSRGRSWSTRIQSPTLHAPPFGEEPHACPLPHCPAYLPGFRAV